MIRLIIVWAWLLIPAGMQAQTPAGTLMDTLSLRQVDSLSAQIPVLFTNKGCGRCVTASVYCEEKGIPLYKISLGIPANRQTMFEVATRHAGRPDLSVMFPVIVYKDLVYYGQSPLNEFLSTLYAKTREEGIVPGNTQ